MNPTRHCTLCENGIMNLEKGLTCKLTKRKPDFKDKCPDIKLGHTFQKRLETAILELANIRRHERITYFTFLCLVITGIIVIIESRNFAEWVYNDSMYIWKSIIGSIALGGSFIIAAIIKLGRFKEKIKAAKSTKDKIDNVLELYGISYTHHFDVEEEIHGTQQATLILDYKNWIKKTTSTSFMVDSKNNIHE